MIGFVWGVLSGVWCLVASVWWVVSSVWCPQGREGWTLASEWVEKLKMSKIYYGHEFRIVNHKNEDISLFPF